MIECNKKQWWQRNINRLYLKLTNEIMRDVFLSIRFAEEICSIVGFQRNLECYSISLNAFLLYIGAHVILMTFKAIKSFHRGIFPRSKTKATTDIIPL